MSDFKIVGLEELIADFNKFGEEAIVEMQPVVNSQGDYLLAKTIEKVPVDSGDLRDSLRVKRPKSKRGRIQNYITWGNDVRNYAASVELGHNLVYMGKRTLTQVKASRS